MAALREGTYRSSLLRFPGPELVDQFLSENDFGISGKMAQVARAVTEEAKKIAYAELPVYQKFRGGRPGARRNNVDGKTYAESFKSQFVSAGVGSTDAFSKGFETDDIGSTLAKSKRPTSMQEVNTLRIAVRNTHPFARLIERGSAPHQIAARSGKKLSFPRGSTGPNAVNGTRGPAWRVAGGPQTSLQAVNHPGTKRYRIMERALERGKTRGRRNLGF